MISHNTIRLRRTSLALAAMLALGGGFAIDASAMSAGQGAMLAAATHVHANDVVIGTLAASQPMHIVMALKLRNKAQLDSFIAAHQQMSAAQFAQRHGPTVAQAQAVANFLSGAGFHNIVIAPNRMLVSADGTAGVAAAAFQTSFAMVQTASGQTGYANNSGVHIPTALQGTVLSVIGLQNVYQAHTTFQKQLGPVPLAVTGHDPVEFASIYGGSGQTTGAGVAVGIVTQGTISQTITDLNTFTSQNGLATVTTQTVNTNGTGSDSSGVDEWNLDSQDIVGMAGGQVGKLVFYNIPTLSNTNLTADFNTVVSANAVKVLNVSLGECETDAQGDGSAAAQDQAFQEAVAQGQTISVSTGDSGADECSNGGVTPSWPAASQYVIAVAGTTLNASTTTWSSETVWSGSGGSESTFEPKPSWQTLWSGTHRGVADVAFDGDPNSGAKIIVNGSSTQVGGTSLSSPLFVGTWARVIAAKGTSVGFAGPLIYQLPASSFHDITSGNNGGETAGPGYDLASGRGSMIISSVLANVGGGGGGGGGGGTPAANFSYVANALAVNFTDSSTDAGGTISAHAWTFGDGGTSTATNPSHTYAASGTYSVTETVTDSVNSTTNAKTESVTVSGGGGGSSVLQNGVGVSIADATVNDEKNFTMVVPAGATNLTFSISGGSGDADLYVRFGSAPTMSTYDCRPWITGNNESCPISNVQAGTYYVMINTYAAYSGVTLTGSYTAPSAGGTPTANFSFSVSGLSASFTDSSTDAGGTIGSHSWNFGDSATSTATNPSHTYAAAGTYSVTETVTDSVSGTSSSKTESVTVSSGGGGGGGGASQLLGNADFESGAAAPWTMSSGIDCSNDTCSGESAHAGSWFVWLNGYGSTHTDTLSQTVTIPSGNASATLSYYLHIDTDEDPSGAAYDKLTVRVYSSAGKLLKTLATYSNLNAASGYTKHSNSLAAYIGKTVRITFTGKEDSSLQTSFVIDDAALNVQ